MDGLKLAQAIKGRWPPIQIIVSWGIDVSTHPDFPIHGRLSGNPTRTGRSRRHYKKPFVVNKDQQRERLA